MNASKNNHDISTPSQWMEGWSKLYENQLTKSEEDLRDIFPNYIVQLFISLVEISDEGKTALEFACGGGENSCALAKYLGYNILAFDALETAITLSKRRARIFAVEDKIHFKVGTMKSYPPKNEKYDLIIALQCLQYLFEETMVKLSEILNSIKPGGYFIYSGNILPHKPTEKPIRFITPEELKNKLHGWNFLVFGTEEILLKKNDLRGYVRLIAQKPME